MKKYKLYFEFYGKKMQTTVEANSEKEAKEIVKNKIKFLKTAPERYPVDLLKKMLGL